MNIIECNECKIPKEYTIEFYGKNRGMRFGLIKTCRECMAKQRHNHYSKTKVEHLERNKKWSKANKENGKCTKCSSLRLKTSNNFCEKHLLQDISHKMLGTKKGWQLLKDKLEKQNYKCHYSGINLILGINASVDHTKPQIRFPELKYEISNLNWVDIKVNRMKRDIEEVEFIEICRLISNK